MFGAERHRSPGELIEVHKAIGQQQLTKTRA